MAGRSNLALLLILITLCVSLCWAEKDEKIELVVWGIGQGEHMKGFYAAIHAFEEMHPNIKVVTAPVPGWGGVMDPQKLMTAIAGGAPPDVINQDRFTISDWASRDAFLPLDDFIKRDADDKYAIHPEEFYPACWSEAVYNGKVYGIPNSTDDRALYYNEDLLVQAGFVDEHGRAKPPRNWDELYEYAIKLTKRDKEGHITRLGFHPLWGNCFLYMYGWLNGGEFMSEDLRRCTLNDPRIVEALEWVVRLIDDLGGAAEIDAFGASLQGGELDPFFTGQLAMKIDGNWYLNNIARYKPDLRFGVVPAPAPKGREPITWSGGFSWAIPRGARHVEEAWEFIKWMVSLDALMIMNEVQQRYAHSRGRLYVPGMTANMRINEIIYEKFTPDHERIKSSLRIFLDLMPHSKFRPVTPVGQLLWDEQIRAVDFAVRHIYTPKEALDIGARNVQRELDKLFESEKYKPLVWKYPIMIICGGLLVLLIVVVVRVRRQPPMGKMAKSEAIAGYMFAAPWIIGFVMFTAGPVLFSIVLSFTKYDVLHPAKFVGFDNYKWLLTKDPLFWRSLGNTLFMVLGVPLGMAVGLGIALLLNANVKGMAVYRTIYYLPAIVPTVASSILWIWVLHPTNGLINTFLKMLHIQGPYWLQSPKWSKPSLILMGLWGAGAGMIIWLAGLKGIPEYLYEAAEIDGANWWGKFRHVTLPMLTPYIFFNLVMGIIGTFQIFAQAYIMTQGGPADSTLFYVYYLFNNAFRYLKMGYASAMAWILFVIVFILTVINFKLAPKWVYYEAEKPR